VATKQKPKGKSPKEPEPNKPAAARQSGAQTEVQRCWEDYWARRAELEAAVTLVKDAHRALDEAREREQDLRRRFDEAKLSLKQLLDVEPSPGTEIDGGDAPVKYN
jgi:hypothetical protein